MAAFQVQTAASNLLAADPDQHRDVTVQNLGPNPIYLETNGAAATLIGGFQVPATGGVVMVRVPPGTALSAIAATANQASALDTRYVVR